MQDESGCRYIHQCPRGVFACRNGECIDAVFKCNGFDDCGDGTDERGCKEQSRHEAQCPESQFRCRKGPCITVHAKCDKVKAGSWQFSQPLLSLVEYLEWHAVKTFVIEKQINL